ncbi:MAG: polyphosphate polymerase domain-containing protein [Oscillospiraceae bacterium]|nr:polyphosphate polymerase domain-containing protein [Oscillospiraceae bacterium]
MSKTPRYRHELKYDIDYSDYLALCSRLKHVMHSDKNAGSDGKYLIKSIYFDNYKDKALIEKISGVPKREKFRIRWYNNDLSYVTLEKKMKISSLTMKVDARWSEAELRLFLSGDYSWMLSHETSLTRELYVKMKTQLIRPRVIVSYLREPLVYGPGNVRVTFDSNICSSLYTRNFLDPQATAIDVTDRPGHAILEVKYDDYLPDIISCMIQSDDCRQQAFSKYSASRRFG